MSELNTWDKQIVARILSYPKQSITQVNNYRIFVHLLFEQETYSSLVSFIENEDWESIKSIKQGKVKFKEDLVIVMFTNQDNQNCLATVYDSDELWQDPEIIDVFILKQEGCS